MLLKFFNKSNGTCKCIVLHLKSINLVTAVFYRLPDTKTNQFLPLLKELKNVLNELHEPTPNILLMGDFNFRFIKWNTNTEHLFCVPRIPDGDRDQYNQAHELIQLCNELFLLQYVAEGTTLTKVLHFAIDKPMAHHGKFAVKRTVKSTLANYGKLSRAKHRGKKAVTCKPQKNGK